MADYTEAFAGFILECRDSYQDLCERIDNGEVPAGTSAEVTIKISPAAIDQIRYERIAAASEANGHG